MRQTIRLYLALSVTLLQIYVVDWSEEKTAYSLFEFPFWPQLAWVDKHSRAETVEGRKSTIASNWFQL